MENHLNHQEWDVETNQIEDFEDDFVETEKHVLDLVHLMKDDCYQR